MRISDWSSDVCSSDLVLALREAAEAVVSEDAAKVRIIREEHAVHVENLALQPAGDGPETGDRGHGLLLVGPDMDADAVVLGDREQVRSEERRVGKEW